MQYIGFPALLEGVWGVPVVCIFDRTKLFNIVILPIGVISLKPHDLKVFSILSSFGLIFSSVLLSISLML